MMRYVVFEEVTGKITREGVASESSVALQSAGPGESLLMLAVEVPVDQMTQIVQGDTLIEHGSGAMVDVGLLLQEIQQ